MITAVRPASTVCSADWTSRSLGMSSSAVASSSTSTPGAAMNALANEMSCRWPGRQPPAALADLGGVAVRQRGDERVRADRPRRRLDLGVGRLRAAEPDVLRDRALEQEALLGDQHDLRAQLASGRSRRSTPSSSTRPVVRVVEPGEQPRHGGLARAGLADHRHRLPRRDVQVEVRQHDRLPVAEPHRVELRPGGRSPPRAASAGDGRLGDGRLLLQDPGDLLQRRRRALEGVVELRHVLQRVEEAPRGTAGTWRARRP